MGHQPRSATAGYGTGERDEESTRRQKAISPFQPKSSPESVMAMSYANEAISPLPFMMPHRLIIGYRT